MVTILVLSRYRKMVIMMPDFCDGEEELCILVVGLMLWRLRMMVVDVDGGECPSIEGMLWPYLALSDWQPHHILFHHWATRHCLLTFVNILTFPFFSLDWLAPYPFPPDICLLFPLFWLAIFPPVCSLLSMFSHFICLRSGLFISGLNGQAPKCFHVPPGFQTTNLPLKSVKINVFLFQPPCEMNLLHHRIQGPPASRK